MSANNKGKREGLITLIPAGGIAKRIRVVASMIQMALEYERPLEIVWFTSDVMPCTSDRLFTLSPQLSDNRITIRQAHWSDYLFTLPPSRDNFFVSLPFTLVRYDRIFNQTNFRSLFFTEQEKFKELMEKKHERLVICTSDELYTYPNMYRRIEATVEVNNVRRSRMSGWGDKVVGIHINRQNEGASFHESPTELFIKRMQKMVEQDDQVQFFIATTSKDEKERLATLFRDRIFVPYSTPDTFSLKGAIQSLGELLALSYTKSILTTPGSSFSEVAAEIGQVPIETLSIFASGKVL